jgi:ribose 5-phosphate isomerase A
MSIDDEKRLAAETAAMEVADGMAVGLGTGSTVAYLLPALARRQLHLRCVATSTATEAAARALGLGVEPFDALERLDVAIDGADQVSPSGWLIKGGGGAHTREKIAAAAAARWIVIVSANKLTGALAPPVPLELSAFGLEATLNAVAPAELRDGPPSPDGGVIADYRGPVGDPAELARWLDGVPGVVGHGLFAPALVDQVVVGRGTSVERLRLSTDGGMLTDQR